MENDKEMDFSQACTSERGNSGYYPEIMLERFQAKEMLKEKVNLKKDNIFSDC